jgi:alpha,alpha-trehalose phosphorylase
MDRVRTQGFQQLLTGQEQYLNDFWRRSDVRVKDLREDRTKRTTLEIQQATRFNLFHIMQCLGACGGHGSARKGPHRAGI